MWDNRTGRRASVKAIFAVIYYLVIPIIAIYLIINTYPELGRERYVNLLYWFIPLSIFLVIISQLSIRYPKGDSRRFALNISYVVVTLIWLLAFLGGGLVVTESWGEYEFSIHLWKYVLLIAGVALFNVLYYALEWAAYKEDIKPKREENIIGSMSLIPLLAEE